MATIAQLGIVYDANTRGLTAGLKKAERQSQTATQAISRHARTMSNRFRSLTGNVLRLSSAIGVLGTAGVGLLVKSQLDAIDKMAKMSRITGITTEDLVAYRHEAGLAGVDTATFDSSMTALIKRIGEARSETGPLITFMKKYDETLLQTLQSQTSNAGALRVIADAIHNAATEADAAAIANAAFSRQGVAMVELFRTKGAAVLDDARIKVHALGLAFNAVDAAKVEAANDAVDDMKAGFTGMARIVAIELADPIKSVADSILRATTGSTEFQDSIRDMTRAAVRNFAEVLNAAATILEFVESRPAMAQFGLIGFVLFGKKGALIGTAIGALFEGVRRELARLGLTTDENTAKLINLEDQLAGVNKMLSMTPADRARSAWGGVVKTTEQLVAQQQELQRQIEVTRGQMQAPEIKAFEETWSRTADNVNRLSQGLRSVSEALIAGLENGAAAPKVSPTPILDIEENPRILANAEEHVFIEEQDKAHMERRKEIFAMGQGSLFSSMTSFLEDMEKAQKSSGAKQIGIMSNAFTRLTSIGAAHSKKMFQLNKVAGIANAIVATYQGAAQALRDVPFPWNIAAAAAVVATGFAQVSAIRSQQFQGGGAAPTVGATATPSVTPIAEQSQTATEPQQDVSITFVGRSFSAEQMRDEIIPSMIEAFKDGTGRGRIRVSFA